METLILVPQSGDTDSCRALNDLGERIYGRADRNSRRLFFVRTNSGPAYGSTTSLQACMRDSSFDNGHTKTRILLDEPCRASYEGIISLCDGIFYDRPDAVIVLVHDERFCRGLYSHLLDPCNPAEFNWSVGKAVAIPHYTHYFRAAERV